VERDHETKDENLACQHKKACLFSVIFDGLLPQLAFISVI